MHPIITEENADAFLRQRAWIEAHEPVRVERLSGGVSNDVFRVYREHAADLVLKQARHRLRVPEEWTCAVERIYRERDVMRLCTRLLDAAPPSAGVVAVTPELLFEDRDCFTIAMTAAPRSHRCWKDELLAGNASTLWAGGAGKLLGQLHAGGWRCDEARLLADRKYFIELRIDPYYRHVAGRFPNLQPQFAQLEESLSRNCLTLVHGDFSPKNLLCGEQSLMLIDFEVGHYGDPAFDVGFFLSHLTLKSCWAARSRRDEYLALADSFWGAYRHEISRVADERQDDELCRRSLANLAGCGLARLEGKSQVDYLQAERRSPVRQMFVDWLVRPRTDCGNLDTIIRDGVAAIF